MSTLSDPNKTLLPKALLRDNNIITWSVLEDYALMKPEESAEFQVLLQTKGPKEIDTRRQFLGAQPQFQHV